MQIDIYDTIYSEINTKHYLKTYVNKLYKDPRVLMSKSPPLPVSSSTSLAHLLRQTPLSCGTQVCNALNTFIPIYHLRLSNTYTVSYIFVSWSVHSSYSANTPWSLLSLTNIFLWSCLCPYILQFYVLMCGLMIHSNLSYFVITKILFYLNHLKMETQLVHPRNGYP